MIAICSASRIGWCSAVCNTAKPSAARFKAIARAPATVIGSA
jgi:hypothetical protein